MNTLFLQYGGHLCLAIILTGLAVLAFCYWTPKYFRCSRCRCDFKPSRQQRSARLVASDLPMTCPACQNATDVLDRNREWLEPSDDFTMPVRSVPGGTDAVIPTQFAASSRRQTGAERRCD